MQALLIRVGERCSPQMWGDPSSWKAAVQRQRYATQVTSPRAAESESTAEEAVSVGETSFRKKDAPFPIITSSSSLCTHIWCAFLGSRLHQRDDSTSGAALLPRELPALAACLSRVARTLFFEVSMGSDAQHPGVTQVEPGQRTGTCAERGTLRFDGRCNGHNGKTGKLSSLYKICRNLVSVRRVLY